MNERSTAVGKAISKRPLLAFGAGGVSVEVFRDVAFRVHPVTDVEARDMLEQKGAALRIPRRCRR